MMSPMRASTDVGLRVILRVVEAKVPRQRRSSEMMIHYHHRDWSYGDQELQKDLLNNMISLKEIDLL